MKQVNKISQFMVKAKNVSPLRIGNGEEDGRGILLCGDRAVIGGTTIAGLFNNYLRNIKKEDRNQYYIDCIINSVFPQQDYNQEENKISTIYFYDCISTKSVLDEENKIQCRRHVRIDSKTSTAETTGLFKEYHISHGCEFIFFFEIKGFLNEELYNMICDYLYSFIQKLVNGQISIGSKSSLGFGRFNKLDNTEIWYKEYNLTCNNSMKEYLEFNMDRLEKINYGKYEWKNINLDQKVNNNIEIKLRVYCEEGFIIKGMIEERKFNNGNRKIDISYEEHSNKIIPASTIKGVVKNHCKKIANILKLKEIIIFDMFGKKQDSNNHKQDIGRRGSVIFRDSVLYKKNKVNDTALYNRIKIDKFTGGAMDMSLRGEEVILIDKDNPIEIIANVNDNNETLMQTMALLLLTFRDIALEQVTIGSGNNVGYGRFTGIDLNIKNYLNKDINIEFNKDIMTNEIQIISNELEEVEEIINTLKY